MSAYKKYDLLRKIGDGGMANIFLAIDKVTNKKVAIKFLKPSDKNDIVKLKRFMHEMRVQKRIDSNYVVKFFGGDIKDENPYIVMEYADGHILKNYIRKRVRLTVEEAVEFTKQMALGFDEIHKHGIIHRDIKSQNIMVTSNGIIKIVDFGIAVDDDSEDLTKTDMLIGSPQYVSPELIRQEAPSVKSDIYALGILLYEMIAGQVPFHARKPIDILRQHQTQQMPRITKKFENVPQSVENAILKATSKNLGNRYKSMYDFYLDLKSVLNKNRINEAYRSPNSKPKKTITSIINSKWTMIVIVGVLMIIIIVLLIVFVTVVKW